MNMMVQSISAEQTKHLRHKVLWPHILTEQECVIDIDKRDDAIHLGTFSDQRLVAIGSLFKMTSPKLETQSQYRLRAMATDPDYRGIGAGKLLVQEAVRILAVMGVEILWCDARLHATGFYKKIGFHLLEEIYDVKNIGPHQFMWIETSRQLTT